MKFLLTRELGRLAKWLRILGLDASYVVESNLSSLIIQALRDNRIILTRNHRLPESRGIRIVLLKAQTLKEQLQEVLKTLDISLEPALMFSRCTICNEELAAVEKEKIKDKVPEYVYKTQEDFMSCPKCNRTYWQGTHWGNVAQTLKKITLR
ncbi:MAG: Mut7-C RNAse domain-containing protein [Candidatus Omnitrophota bacterium]